MAQLLGFSLSPLLSLSRISTRKCLPSTPSPRRTSLRIRASEIDLLGDFGARDPFPAEIESNFADKVQGNVNTEHKILIPNASALSLAQMNCAPISDLQQLSVDDAKKLLFKVVGWKLVDEGEGLKLEGLWKVRDEKCGEELINRIRDKVESTGHLPELHFEAPNQVRARLWTSSIGGLSFNDFIVAAKIDEIKVSDLQPRLRVWA
ncbi:probable pterin-4-alpha-carbinolamine dehydratase, chloroplastic [Salvia miltiorrhiza]|uniref:probable pterin-4-alpha-carbinolamine dehydratase, chloroplastic n=1 Tax=Salvia miltiorrhiza TaxID=226208 RepID=UPI0025AD4257|nr:probable pterin-4-alpha-carbinolamine dehydratase, chloroplastic [Salvia miltiorrhiza]